MILITTAGKVGSEAARVLARDGVPVRVLTRRPTDFGALSDAGVDVREGDLTVPSSIDGAMAGVTSMILVSPPIPELEINAIESAVRADVGHVVKVTSKASSDSPIARRRTQAQIEGELIASGLGYTLLRNNGYMQNMLMLAPLIAKTNGFGSSAGQGRLGTIDVRDVAAVAAAIAAAPSGHAGKTYWPTGPELLSFGDMAAVLSQVLRRPIEFKPLTLEQEKQGMVAAGLPEHLAAMNAQAMSLVAEGDSDWCTDDVPDILGRPARTFKQFATDHAAAFAPVAA